MNPIYRVPLASRSDFRRRLVTSGSAGLILVALSLAVGVAGYMYFETLPPVDAFVNAAMLLSGMGPLKSPETTGGKLFAGCYAIYCGFAVLGIGAIIFAPIVHRMFHKMHIADAGDKAEAKPRPRGK